MTRVLGECVCVAMLLARQVLEGDVVCVDHFYPPRKVANGVLSPVQPAHHAVVCPDSDFLSIEIQPFIGPTRHLIGQFLHHVISGNIKRRPRYITYDNDIFTR